MNKFRPSKRSVLITAFILALIVIAVLAVAIHRGSITRRYEQYALKQQLTKQLNPLRDSLTDLGFTNVPTPSATCNYVPSPSGSKSLACSATIQKYIVVGSGADVSKKLDIGAAKLSKQFDVNGWHQRQDLRTIQWFDGIAKGIDYQPDQLNVKQLSDMTCTIDFFTAFSRPKEPAINLVAICVKPKTDIPIQ